MPRKDRSEPASLLARENANDEIYERIYIAILEHRLHPGTKLGEDRLAKIFDVSRARVREVLNRLAHEQIVELYPQRGAFVAKPTPQQAMDVFEARRLIEPALVRRLIARRDPSATVALRDIVAEEQRARAKQDRPTM
ncbi:MAG: GntR family transcriptional regulator, partial [Ottowia sp.]